MSHVNLPATGASPAPRGGATRPPSRLTRWIADPRFQAWAARMPLLSRLVRREGAAMFDIVAGFCHSQILMAVVSLELPRILLEEECQIAELARRCDVPPDRMAVLVRGAIAIGLLRQRRSGHVGLTTRGAALAGVPGLSGMIQHHAVLYRDLADPVAFFRGDVATELADFWPYVFGAGAANDPDTAAAYSKLMTDTQALVAADTIAALRWADSRALLDVGGGAGAFLAAVGQAQPHLDLHLFDLPAVVPAARGTFEAAGLSDRVTLHPGSFRDDPLPTVADTISLVRVLYDHADATVADLLRAAHQALPKGGRIIVSEPMSGGAHPDPATDGYFALYCMAMRTGRVRSAAQVSQLLVDAGFDRVRIHRARRPYVTQVISAVRPA